MSDPRTEILAAVAAHSAGPPPTPPPVPLLGRFDLDVAARLQTFAERLTAVGGNALLLPDADSVAPAIAEILHRTNAQRIACAPDLAPLCDNLDVSFDAPLLDCDAGITRAQWGIAETGTLILETDRLRSLLPPIHIAVLPASRMLATLGEAIKTLPRPLPRAVTFITGPSRTADIELNLVVGVHGPREVHVLLVPG